MTRAIDEDRRAAPTAPPGPIASSGNTDRHRLGVLAGALFAALAALPASADDTEIFFGNSGTVVTEGDPNVLFVLDTSGSMGSLDGGTETRLDRVKEALYRIVDKSENVNVGLMRFQGHLGGSSVIYPMTPIGDDACAYDECDDVEVIARVSAPDDDTEEDDTEDSTARWGGSILTMGDETEEQLVGVRFPDLDVPQGATITSARIEFRAQRNGQGNPSYNVYAHATDNADPFQNAADSVDGRDRATAVAWSPGNWQTDKRYATSDLSATVQEIVDRDGWCGGNAISFEVDRTSDGGRRDGWSYEYALDRAGQTDTTSGNSGTSDAPDFDDDDDIGVDGAAVLRLTYDPISVPATGGCRQGVALAQVSAGTHDAEEGSDGSLRLDSSDLELPRDGTEDQYVGLHFDKARIPAGATILDARIEFQVKDAATDEQPVSLYIDVENKTTPTAFGTGTVNDATNRPLSGSPVGWSDVPVPEFDGQKLWTPNLATLVQGLVNDAGWDVSRPINFQISRMGGEGTRTVESYDGQAGAAPKLLVRYRAPSGTAGAGADTSVRSAISRVVSDMGAGGGTPIVDALYEAAQYYRGGPVDYGKTRGFAGTFNGWNYDFRTGDNRVSAARSWTGDGTIQRSDECAESYPDGEACEEEEIVGSATYISPMTASCQTSHVVLLTDGAATSTDATNRVLGLPGVGSCTEPDNWGEKCGLELAEWMYSTDHRPALAEHQNLALHTIGFNTQGDDVATGFARNLATQGGGGFYEANDANELVAAFDRIVGVAQTVDTSFVAPGATVNQFNRLTHRDDIYFALFKPEIRPVWNGNLKRYKVGEETEGGGIAILDEDLRNAVDDETGFFDTDARSWWGPRDGSDIARGGAAGRLPARSQDRNLYTFLGEPAEHAGNSTIVLTNAQSDFHEDNAGLTNAKLGLPSSTSDEKRAEIIRRARGVDVGDVDGDGDVAEQVGHIGDPMHSRPVILNYDNPNSDDPEEALTTVFMGTNEGFLHAIDREFGKELFAFMPQELLPNLPKLAANNAPKHPYGLDGTLSIWLDEDDDTINNVVDPGEKAFLYIGMRRGGKSYYAFDVTNRTSPKLAWAIHGGPNGTDGFEELGESWSRPVPTEIFVDGERKSVVIFAAGYATTQDPDYDAEPEDRTRVEDRIGRGFFIVDAETGAPVHAVLNTALDETRNATNLVTNSWIETNDDMTHSVPGDIRVIDVDFDGLADQMWFGDLGGNVWRYDFTPYHSGRITPDGIEPLLRGGIMASLGGDGVESNRRFYYEPDVSLVGTEGKRSLSIGIGSGWRANPLNTVADDRFYVLKSDAVFEAPADYGRKKDDGGWAPITDDDLTDVTDDLSPDSVSVHGWYMDLEQPGEKVLGDSITVNNQVVFTSYLPKENLGSCESNIGTGRVYAVSVFDGSPSLARTDGDEASKDDRFEELVHGGIPPEPAALITDKGPTILVGPEQPLDLDFNNLTQRSYWRDNGRQKPAAALPVDDSETGDDDEGTAEVR